MNLTLVISQNCAACLRAETILKNLQANYENILLSIVDVKKFNNNQLQITPALLIDKIFYSTIVVAPECSAEITKHGDVKITIGSGIKKEVG